MRDAVRCNRDENAEDIDSVVEIFGKVSSDGEEYYISNKLAREYIVFLQNIMIITTTEYRKVSNNIHDKL